MNKHEKLPGGEHITTWGDPLLSSCVLKAEETLGLEDTTDWQTAGCMAHFNPDKKFNLPVGVRVAQVISSQRDSKLGVSCQFFSGACGKCLLGESDQVDSTPCAPYESGAAMVSGVLPKKKS